VRKRDKQLARGTDQIARLCPRVDLEALPDPALIVGPDGRIVAENALAETLLGRPRRELVGAPVDAFLQCPGVAAGSARQVEYVSSHRNARAIHRSGREIPVELMLSPDPSDAALVVSIKEIAPAQPPAAARDEDVTAIGHDLKQPMSVIALEVAMLETRIAPPPGSDLERSFKRIERNLTAIDKLLDDLLDFASIDAACFRIYREPIDLAGLVADVVDRIVSSSERARVRVATDGPIRIEADGRRLERVVANLVQNALKYAPRDTPIDVCVERRATCVRVSVTDRGPGLAPDDASRVFERFRRARSARDKSGTGLGLYVSRKIVEAHGGRLCVDSVFGQGSCFWFELPYES